MSEQRIDSGAEDRAHLQETTALSQEQQRGEEPSASASPGGANPDGSNPEGEDIPARSELGHGVSADGPREQ